MKQIALAILFCFFSTLAFAQGCGQGNPNCVAPTPPIGDNSNRIATTAFVQMNGGGGGGAVSSVFGRVGAVTAQTSDYAFSQISGALQLSQIQVIGSNTVLGNLTGGSATPAAISIGSNTVLGNATGAMAALAVPSCSASNNAIQWTTGTGWGCTTISGGGGGGSPGGTNGQIQFNSSGAFGGFTLGGDATVNTGSGAMTLATVNSNVGTFGAAGIANSTTPETPSIYPIITANAKGLITAIVTSTAIAQSSTLTGTILATNITTASITTLTGQIASYNGAAPTNGQTLIGNGSAFVAATLTAGTGITVTNGAGTITIANGGVTSLGGMTGAITCGAGVTCSGSSIATSGGSGVVNGYLYGCTLSNDGGTPNTKLDVSSCYAADSTNTVMMNLSSAVIDFTTTGANGLDQGSIGASSRYGIFEIENISGPTIAAIATLETAGSFPSPTMPSGYAYKRYIGTVLTNASSQIIAFSQNSNQFLFNTVIGADLNVAAPATAQTLLPLTVPLGLSVYPIIQVKLDALASRHNITFWTPSTLSAQGITLDSQNTTESYTYIHTIWTDTSGRLEYQDTTPTTSGTAGVVRNLTIQTLGWIDPLLQGGGGSGGGGGGGGSGTVNAAAAGLCAYYPGPGTIATVSGEANCSLSAGAMTLGTAGSVVGQIKLSGNSSQVVTITAQATAGNVTVNAPSVAGTLVATATSPLAISAAGNISISVPVPLNIGGTNANLTAINGGVVYSTASAFAITAAGTANQILISNGAAAPTWANIASNLTAGSCISITGTTNATIGINSPATVSCGGTGRTTFTANLPLIGNGTGGLNQGTVTSTNASTVFMTGSNAGPYVLGDCLKIDANANAVDCQGGALFNGQANYYWGADYGMNCNASADNASAFNSLMAAATGANSLTGVTGYGIVMLPAGQCNFATKPNNVVIPSPGGLKVVGAGAETTLLWYTITGNFLTFDDTANTNWFGGSLTLADFSTVTTQANSTGSGITLLGTGIGVGGAQHAPTHINRVYAHGSTTSGPYWQYGIIATCMSQIFYDGVMVQGNDNGSGTRSGVGLEINCSTATSNVAYYLSNIQTDILNIGIEVSGTATIEGLIANNWTAVGVNNCGNFAAVGSQYQITQGNCDSYQNGFNLLGPTDGSISNMGIQLRAAFQAGIQCGDNVSKTCNLFTFTGNNFTPGTGCSGCAYNGIVLSGTAASDVVNGNICYNSTSACIVAQANSGSSGAQPNKVYGNRCNTVTTCVSDSTGGSGGLQVGTAAVANN